MQAVDVGPGLCVLMKIPPDSYLVYDAGHWNGDRCVQGAHEFVQGDMIDLMIISHSDSDHLGDADEILEDFEVQRIIHTGYERDRDSWRDMMDAIADEVRDHGASVRNLASHPIEPGEEIPLSDGTLTLVAGWHDWTASTLGDSENRNVVSIVARLDYAGRSVLLSGDTIGRDHEDPPEACHEAEAIMVGRHRAHVVSLVADVLVAPHHGGNNASSQCFIDAVDPLWVVFSAGHKYGHPGGAVAERYLAEGVPVEQILRTDRGDDEDNEPKEWKEGSIEGCEDARGDDDIVIVIRSDGDLRVNYIEEAAGC